MKDIQLNSMDELFKAAGYDYRYMSIDEPVEILSEKVYIKSFNHDANQIELAQVTRLIRKENSVLWELRLQEENTILLTASPNHYIWSEDIKDYIQLCQIDTPTCAKLSNGETAKVVAKSTKKVSPILDISVEGNHNYFSNGVLSKNSGGNAMKFYATIRLDIRRREAIKSGDDVLGAITQVKVIKNKVAPPFKSAFFNIVYGAGIDKETDMVAVAVDLDIIKRAGAWYSYKGANIGQGLNNATTHLRDQPKLMNEIREKVAAVLQRTEEEEECMTE